MALLLACAHTLAQIAFAFAVLHTNAGMNLHAGNLETTIHQALNRQFRPPACRPAVGLSLQHLKTPPQQIRSEQQLAGYWLGALRPFRLVLHFQMRHPSLGFRVAHPAAQRGGPNWHLRSSLCGRSSLRASSRRSPHEWLILEVASPATRGESQLGLRSGYEQRTAQAKKGMQIKLGVTLGNPG